MAFATVGTLIATWTISGVDTRQEARDIRPVLELRVEPEWEWRYEYPNEPPDVIVSSEALRNVGRGSAFNVHASMRAAYSPNDFAEIEPDMLATGRYLYRARFDPEVVQHIPAGEEATVDFSLRFRWAYDRSPPLGHQGVIYIELDLYADDIDGNRYATTYCLSAHADVSLQMGVPLLHGEAAEMDPRGLDGPRRTERSYYYGLAYRGRGNPKRIEVSDEREDDVVEFSPEFCRDGGGFRDLRRLGRR